MGVCALSIPPDTEQVRVARLVACAAARRSGLAEDEVDDVRLAVGEAVGRAVLRHQRRGLRAPVDVRMLDLASGFEVAVADAVSGEDDDVGLAMAVITGLVPDLRVDTPDRGGQVLRMAWPAGIRQ